MAVRWNPYTNEFEDDEGENLLLPSTGAGNLGQDFVVAQTPGSPTIMDTAGNTGSFVNGTWTPTPDTTNVSWLSSLPKGLQDAFKAFTSPQGIAGLGGAALGFLNRPEPSGGGTTMAYPGAAQLQRKMVQGPYGPLAEYTGPGGGAPDYTPFRAPTIAPPPPAAAPAPGAPGTGMSVQAKVDLYKQLAGYGLGPDRIRRIAETMYGAIPDTDWNELTRLAGVGTGIAAPAAPPPVGGITTPPPVGTPAPSGPPPGALTGPPKTLVTDPAQMLNEYSKLRGFSATVGADTSLSADSAYRQLEAKYGPLSATQKQSLESAYQRNLAKPTGIGQQVKDYSPEAKAATYENYLARGLTDAEVRAMAEKQFGPQKESDWAYLKTLAAQLPDDLLPATGASPNSVQTEAAVLKARLPDNWDNYSPKQKSDWFNANNATPAMLKSQGVTDAQLQALRENGYKFAQGGPVQMEDGGFVLTKRAVDGAGGPRGIQQLVPGARMVRGPGTGTSDDIPAVINGRNGQTPARLSNGEAYVPKRFVQDQGGPQRMYALMNNLQRKA